MSDEDYSLSSDKDFAEETDDVSDYDWGTLEDIFD